MRKFVVLALLCSFVLNTEAQPTDPPYKKAGIIPGMAILGTDSSTITTLSHLPKDMPLLVVNFHTTCHHCQDEVRDIIKNKSKFKKVRIVMISLESLPEIREFYEKFNLDELKNLVIGKDFRYASISFYTFKKYPFSALYSKDHKFLNAFESTTTADTILGEFRKHKAL